MHPPPLEYTWFSWGSSSGSLSVSLGAGLDVWKGWEGGGTINHHITNCTINQPLIKLTTGALAGFLLQTLGWISLNTRGPLSWLSWGLSVLPRDLSGGCCGHCGLLLLWESVGAGVTGAVSWVALVFNWALLGYSSGLCQAFLGLSQYPLGARLGCPEIFVVVAVGTVACCCWSCCGY